MLVVKIFVVLVLAYFSVFDTCKIPDTSNPGKNFMRNMIQNNGSVNFASDYVFLREEKSYERKILQHLRHPINNYIRLHFVEIYGMVNTINFMLYYTDEIVSYRSYDVKVDMEFLKEENCVENIEIVAWKIPSKEPFCLMILACHVTRGSIENSFNVQKRLLFIADEKFNYSTLNSSLIGFDYKPSTSTFVDLYLGEGFCMCDYLKEYFNECKIDGGIDIQILALMLLLFFIPFCVLAGIYLKIVEDNAE
jgi:hypothetical protein